MIVAILLAAGKSSRTGNKYKLLLPYKNKTIIAHSINNLLNSDIDRIIIVVGKAQHQIKKHIITNKKIKIYYNKSYPSGMASSIKIGMKYLPKKTKSFFITLADMPNIQPMYYNAMINIGKKIVTFLLFLIFKKNKLILFCFLIVLKKN